MKTITNITGFVTAVREAMERRLPDYEVREISVTKMNDLTLEGLTARLKGETAGATVYLNRAFEEHINGEKSIEAVADSMAEVILGSRGMAPVRSCEELDLSFENIRDLLSVRLISSELNKVYLEDKPHRFVADDLVLVAEIDLGNDYSTVITNSMAEDYDILELFDTAVGNMEKRFPAVLTSLEGAIFGDRANVLESGDRGHIEGMYVLTVDEHRFGASALAYEGLLRRIHELMGSDFYILPSSTDETIILKADGTADVRALKDMVIQANQTVVERADWLSNNVYISDADGLHRVA